MGGTGLLFPGATQEHVPSVVLQHASQGEVEAIGVETAIEPQVAGIFDVVVCVVVVVVVRSVCNEGLLAILIMICWDMTPGVPLLIND
jgi:hypothetical protein